MTSPTDPAPTEAGQTAFLQSIARLHSPAGLGALDDATPHKARALLCWYQAMTAR